MFLRDMMIYCDRHDEKTGVVSLKARDVLALRLQGKKDAQEASMMKNGDKAGNGKRKLFPLD
jgi:hypothetical protein